MMKDVNINKLLFLKEGLISGLFNNNDIVKYADNLLIESHENSEVLMNLSLSKTNKESLSILKRATVDLSPGPNIGLQLFNYALRLAEGKSLTIRELLEVGQQIAVNTEMNLEIIKTLDNLENDLFQAEDGIVPQKRELFEQNIIDYFKKIITQANNGEHAGPL